MHVFIAHVETVHDILLGVHVENINALETIDLADDVMQLTIFAQLHILFVLCQKFFFGEDKHGFLSRVGVT